MKAIASLVLAVILIGLLLFMGGLFIWAATFAYRSLMDFADGLIEQDVGLANLVLLAGILAAGFLIALFLLHALFARYGPRGLRLNGPMDIRNAEFPAIETTLIMGGVPVFDVEVRGENLLVSFGKPREKFSVTQEVRVAAPSYQHACLKAVETVRSDKGFRAKVQNKIDDLPRLYINSIEQIQADKTTERVGLAEWQAEGMLSNLTSRLANR